MTNSIEPGFGEVPANQSAQRIDSVAWALFFIWLGIAMLAKVPWAWFLAGVGSLTVLAHLCRWWMHAKVDRFWLACGVIFLAAGLWDLLQIEWPLAAASILLLGIVLLGRAIAAFKS